MKSALAAFFQQKRLAWLAPAAGALLTFSATNWLFPAWLERLEFKVYDQAARLGEPEPPHDLAIIAIDDASVEQLGPRPWPRSTHARLLDQLTDGGSPLVAFVMPLADSPSETQRRSGLEQLQSAVELLEKSGAGETEHTQQLKALLNQSVNELDEDGALMRAIKRHGDVLVPVEARIVAQDAHAVAADMRQPIFRLAQYAHGVAHIAFLADVDGVLRADHVTIRDGDRLVPSMSVAVVARQRQLDLSQIDRRADTLLLDAQSLSLDQRGRWQAPFYRTSGQDAIATYSYWEVLNGSVPAQTFQGKTVLIGATDRTTPLLATPLGAQPAVTVVASFVASIGAANGISHPAWMIIVQWALALAVGVYCARLLPQIKLSTAFATTILLALALSLLEIGALNLTGVWVQLIAAELTAFGALLGVAGLALIRRLDSTDVEPRDAVEQLRILGQTFQRQGQLDLAFETFRRRPNDHETLNLLYELGQDYEKCQQFQKAAEVYAHISSAKSDYKDTAQRRDRMRRLAAAPANKNKPPAPTKLRPSPVLRSEPLRAAVEDFEPVIVKQVPKQTLGRYEIERELGKGAMGIVYLGRDPQINRVVAIKAIALAEEFAEEDLTDARARFFREAEMAGCLNHPNIVTVYDAGEDRGLAYIAMEYVRGEHLSNYTDSTRLLPAAKALNLAARVADALEYAHKQNVVHRDVKPANIMFNIDTDALKLTDFGIARLTDASRTKTGIVLGTPSFMSPEQLEGRPLDGRSDLFALGVSVYQLLAGHLPFRADSMTRLMHKIALEPHEPLRSLRPELPDLAEQIIDRALAKAAADRFQTGGEMANALRTCSRLIVRKEVAAR